MNKISKSESEWREQLSESQFQVCRLKGTERPFTGAYYRNTTPGYTTASAAMRHCLTPIPSLMPAAAGRAITNRYVLRL